jgi:hypothetical protein
MVEGGAGGPGRRVNFAPRRKTQSARSQLWTVLTEDIDAALQPRRWVQHLRFFEAELTARVMAFGRGNPVTPAHRVARRRIFRIEVRPDPVYNTATALQLLLGVRDHNLAAVAGSGPAFDDMERMTRVERIVSADVGEHETTIRRIHLGDVAPSSERMADRQRHPLDMLTDQLSDDLGDLCAGRCFRCSQAWK